METGDLSVPAYVTNIRPRGQSILRIDTSGWVSAGLRSYVRGNLIVVGLVFYDHHKMLPDVFEIIDYDMTDWISVFDLDTVRHKTSIIDLRSNPEGETDVLLGWKKEDYFQWKLTK